MFAGLRKRWNRDKLRNAELQAILAETEQSLDISTDCLAECYLDRDSIKSQLESIEQKHGDQRLYLEQRLVEATKKGMEFEQKYDHSNLRNAANARALKEHMELIDRLRESYRDALAEGSRTVEQMTKAEAKLAAKEVECRTLTKFITDQGELLDLERHRIVLAVAALTRDLPTRPANEVRVEMETFSLN